MIKYSLFWLFWGTLCVAGVRTIAPPDLRHDTDVNQNSATFSVASDFELIEDNEKESQMLSIGNSIPGSMASVGKLFRFQVPADTFRGIVSSYKFDSLPSWLVSNPEFRVLEGVPSKENIGAFTVRILAVGSNGETAGPVEAEIKVVESAENNKNYSNLKFEGCLCPEKKVVLIEETARVLNISTDMVSLIPMMTSSFDYDSINEIDSEDLNIQEEKDCYMFNISYPSEFEPLRSKLRSKINNILETRKPAHSRSNKKLDLSVNREKRQAESSGDDYYGDYNYDNYNDYFEKFDKPTDPTPTTTLVTPVFSETSDLSPLDSEGILPTSPVFNTVPLSTPAYIPVKPTRIVESSPTFAPKTEDRERTIDPTNLDSSLLVHPTTSADFTTPLTTSSSGVPEPTRVVTEPIEATSVPEQDKEKSTEYGMKNFPPRIHNRIQKQAWVAGTLYRMPIPDDTFFDFEDGDTRNLTLVLKDESGSVFAKDSWIQFDPSKQEIYALPLEKHIGRYDFRIEAIDKGRKSAIDYLEINVWQHNQARIFNHQFTAVLKMEKKYEYDFAYALDWQVKAVEKIAAMFHDNVFNVNVRNITDNPVQVSWTNVSLVNSLSSDCPKEKLEELTKVMLSGHGSEPTREARHVFLPEFQLKRIHSHFFDSCEPLFHHGGSDAHPFNPVDGHGGETKHNNTAPIFRNQIDQLSVIVGHLYRYQVPDHTCYDMEDGNARNLKMRILTLDLSEPSGDSWLHFDSANQEFFGVPLKEDIGTKEYFLECIDRGGKSVSDALIVEVREESWSGKPKPVLFTLTIDTPYEAFIRSPYDKARLVNRLGRAFGDPRPAKNVAIRKFERGSVKVEWSNASLPNDPCPYDEVQRLREIMTDANGGLRKEFRNVFLPDFIVTDGGSITPSGSCLAGDTPTHPETPDDGDEPTGDQVSSPSDEDYLLTFVIPAVIIGLMLFLAALIACCLYRRRRYGKMSMMSHTNGNQTFVTKGIPVIFAEELDDQKADDNAKSPVIMKEEKPPLPPPEYYRSTPPRNDRHRPGSAADLNTSDDAPYNRPPPFTSSNGASRNQRPNLPPAYKKTPTYVPP